MNIPRECCDNEMAKVKKWRKKCPKAEIPNIPKSASNHGKTCSGPSAMESGKLKD